MASLERDVENRFFELITKQKQNPSSNAYGVYQKLVYFRYEEVIKNTFLEFCKHISENELEKTIYSFLENPVETPFVWQIAKDYMKHCKKMKFFHDRKYLYELLYFDWMEVELTMKEYKEKKNRKFSWDAYYKLSNSVEFKKCKYDIINKDYETKRDNIVLSYFDFKDLEVYFREVNEFIYYLLKDLNKKATIQEKLNKLCIENEINLEEAKTILEEPLKELLSKKVLI